MTQAVSRTVSQLTSLEKKLVPGLVWTVERPRKYTTPSLEASSISRSCRSAAPICSAASCFFSCVGPTTWVLSPSNKNNPVLFGNAKRSPSAVVHLLTQRQENFGLTHMFTECKQRQSRGASSNMEVQMHCKPCHVAVQFDQQSLGPWLTASHGTRPARGARPP